MDITLRALGPDDHALLCAVPDGLFDNAIDPAQARAFLADPLHVMVMAFVDDLVVGMGSGTILLHPDKLPAFFVNEVGTRDGWTRRGIATRLCRRLFELAREKGCTGGIWLGTEQDNMAALALYRSLQGKEVPGVFFGWDDAL